MSHLVLLLPILGLGAFWLFPTEVAIPIYLAVLVVSGLLYVVAMRAARRPVETGAEGMMHKLGRVVDSRDDRGRVEVEGEIWWATSAEPLHAGDVVEVIGLADGMTLRVRAVVDPGR